MTLRSISKRTVPRAKTRISSKAQKVIDKGMEFVNRHNPYCYHGGNKELNKNARTHVEDLNKKYSSKSNYKHIIGDEKTKDGYNYKKYLEQDSSEHLLVDCSGFTSICFKNAGISISTSAATQRSNATSKGQKLASLDEAKPGDLLWRDANGGDHVAIVGADNVYALEAIGWNYGCKCDSRKVRGETFNEAFRLIEDDSEDPGTEPDPGIDPGTEPDPGGDVGTENLLSTTQARAAVLYNKKNNQSICKQIQALVGVTTDGSFGYETVQAIARWQKSKGLTADGKFGPASKRAAGFGASAPVVTTPVQTVQTETLTNTQIQSAISYNKRNNQSICKKIQALVGVTVDGIFGTLTIQGIANWQAVHNLTADGKFGPACKAAAGF